MQWECSECGGLFRAEGRPVVCSECGMAGTIVHTEAERAEASGELDDLRATWLSAGFARASGSGFSP
ncbi:MAG: hypothetical protein JWN48_1780 [Myxococcaceae bacterium]|nr:hypothetical protein [Myxococcaceae bacterium]